MKNEIKLVNDYKIKSFIENPMKYLFYRNDKYLLIYNKHYLGKYDNALDALSARDSFVFEWTGLDISKVYEVKDLYSKYRQIGNILIDQDGRLFYNNFTNVNFYGNKKVAPIKCNNGKKIISLRRDHVDILASKKGLILDGNKYITPFENDFILSSSAYDGFIYVPFKRSYERPNKDYPKRKYFGVYKQTRASSYQAAFILNRKKKLVGNFYSPIEAEQAYFDIYYLFKGELHKGDTRAI